MAASRSRRANAGTKMNKLIEEEEDEDDFYKTTYGGFNEVQIYFCQRILLGHIVHSCWIYILKW